MMNPIRALRELSQEIDAMRAKNHATRNEIVNVNNSPTRQEVNAIREEIHAIRNEINDQIKNVNALATEHIHRSRLAECRNDFARLNAGKHFSQTDEDGITLAILNRTGFSSTPTFVEIGVGDGLENNSLVLLASGWRGCWLGGQDLAFNLPSRSKLHFTKAWIDLDNFSTLFTHCLDTLSVESPDLISIDLDGNDFYFCNQILASGVRPRVFICEYNAIFPPHAKWVMPYNAKHEWGGDHLFSASLASFNDLFVKHGYFLCACNPQTGANAFFVQNKYKSLFPDVPAQIDMIYMSPFYRLDNRFTHTVSSRFIESILQGSE